MKVLIGCEYSGTVRDAFIAKGHSVISCDLLPTDVPGPHYHGDIYDLLDQQWDLIIAHPPCTALCASGNRYYASGKLKYAKRLSAASWTENLWNACKRVCKKVAFENPVGVLASLTCMPRARYVHPYQFGHLEQKKTGLHLYGLEPLVATDDVYLEMKKLPINKTHRIHYVGSKTKDRWKIRSTTYQGIADAMASQWGAV